MKTKRFIFLAMLWFSVAAMPLVTFGYVELSDDEMNRLAGGHGTEEWIPGETLRGGQIYYVSGFSTNGASYYLYIPSAYDGVVALPSMIFMNAARHGLGPLLKWMPSAEDLDWIIVVPHDIGNDGPDNSSMLLREINRHFRSTFRHDIRRLYVGGVSGGSCRAYLQAKSFRGEYAGVIDVVGWMCDYDEYTYYPRRLAVVHLNGEPNRAGAFRNDDTILHRDGVRTKMINYDGGHHYPESALADEALLWLDQDFEQAGKQFTFPDAEQRASELMQKAQVMVSGEKPENAVPLLLEVLSEYAYSTNAFGAEEWLLGLLRRHAASELGASIDVPPEALRRYARLLYQRAFYYSSENFPEEMTRLLSGLAVALDPEYHHAFALHASSLVHLPYRTKQDVLFARELLNQAIVLGPAFWIGFHNRAELALLCGQLSIARGYLDRALEPAQAWRDPFKYNENTLTAEHALLDREIGNRILLPWAEYFMSQATGVIHRESYAGSYAPSGKPEIVEDHGAAGGRALVLTESNDVIRFNFFNPKITNMYASFMLLPEYGDPEPSALLYNNIMGFRIDARGIVNRISREGGLTNWVALHHAPLDPDAWSIITVSIDMFSGMSQTFINGQPVLPNIPLPTEVVMPSFIALESWSSQPIRIDAITVSESPPPDDLDRDTLPDEWELASGLHAYVMSGPRSGDESIGPNGDPDGDGLTNLREFLFDTQPLNADSDGDKMTDGSEVAHGFNPLVADPFNEIALPSGSSFAEALEDDWNQTDDIRMRVVGQEKGKGQIVEILPSLGDCRMTRYYASGPKTVIWLTLSMQPTPGLDADFTEAMKQGAALVYMNMEGHLVAFDGSASIRQWIALDQYPFPLDQIIKIRLRLDYRNKTWSIWQGSNLLADDLGFANPDKTHFSTITFEGTGLLEAFHVAAHGPDDDGDGVPDDWEKKFFKGLDHVKSDTDNDGDGFPDISEYLAGTNPLDPESQLEIIDVQLNGNQLSIIWEAKAENYEGNPISYNLLKSKSMNGGVMAPIAHEIRPNGVMCTYEVTGDPEAITAFYSIQANP
jgi:Bacterial TSP3 repeat